MSRSDGPHKARSLDSVPHISEAVDGVLIVAAFYGDVWENDRGPA